MRLAILGFGLIGGSVARALHARAPGRWEVVAWSPSGAGPREAAAAGIAVAAEEPIEALAGADLVLVAAPPLATLEALDGLADAAASGALAPDAIVSDVASTKSAIVARAAGLGLRFVGGHPMAGRETSGFGAATADLFVDRPWVVTPGTASEGDVASVEELARATGARPVRMDADTHDEAVAAVSHLPLVVSAALVEAVVGREAERDGWPVAAALAATGWAGMVRLARGDPAMAAGIVATNRGPLERELRGLRDVLDEWLAAIGTDPPDADALAARFRAARERASAE